MLTTEKHDRCPACRNTSSRGADGVPFRAIDAKEFLRLLGK
jgi:hypothetical protein